jgi:peptide/nickel transport system substrate-binding protein
MAFLTRSVWSGPQARRNVLWRAVPVLAVSAALLLSACSGGSGGSSSKESSSGPVADGGDLVVGVGALPPTLSPYITQPTPPRSFTVTPMYSYLTTVDAIAAGAPIKPSVASSWEQTNPTTWKFTLRPGLTFSNGEALDATAVKAAADYTLDKKNAAGITAAIGPIASVDAVNATTVVFNLKTAEYDMPRLLTILPLVPPRDFATRGADAFFANPIASGYFKLDHFTPGQELKLVKNPASVMGTTHISSVTFKVIAEDGARISALKTGAVQMITKVPTDQVKSLQAAKLDILSLNEARLYMTDLYKASGPLNDVRVRQALNYALDTKSLVANVMGGYGLDEQGQLSPPSVAGYCKTVTSYPYDLKKANQLMTEAGVSHLNLTFGTSQGFLLNDSLLAQAIAAQLEKLDAVDTVKVETMEFSNYLDVFNGKKPAQDMFAWGMSSAPGLDITRNLARFTTTHSDRNPGNYSNPTLDKLYDQLVATPPTDPKRNDLDCQISQLIKDQALVLYGFYTPDIWGTTSVVKDFKVDANGNPRWLEMSISK